MDVQQEERITRATNVKSRKKAINRTIISRKQTSDTDRQRIVKAYLNGAKPKTISDTLGVNVHTVYNILNLYRNTGKLSACSRGGNHKKILSIEAGQNIRDWLQEDSTLSLKQLARKVWEQYRVRVSTATVAREVRPLRSTLKQRKLIEEANRWNNVVTTSTKEASQSHDDSAASDDCSIFIKEECTVSSDVDEQCSDGIEVEEAAESHHSEDDPVEVIAESNSSENHLSTGKQKSSKVVKSYKQIIAEQRLNLLDTHRPKGNYITTSIKTKQQPKADNSHPQPNTQATDRCTFTMEMLGEPYKRKTVTVALPKMCSLNSPSIDSPIETNAASAPNSCTHCTCFYQLVSEQKKMFEQFSTFQEKIATSIQQVQESLMKKLSDIQQCVKLTRRDPDLDHVFGS